MQWQNELDRLDEPTACPSPRAVQWRMRPGEDPNNYVTTFEYDETTQRGSLRCRNNLP